MREERLRAGNRRLTAVARGFCARPATGCRIFRPLCRRGGIAGRSSGENIFSRLVWAGGGGFGAVEDFGGLVAGEFVAAG